MKLNCLSRSLKTSLMCGVAVSGFAVTNAMAQDAAQADDDVIIVTARKKNETLIEVPMNITAVGSVELEARNLIDTADLFRTVAGASFPRTQVILRGLSGGNDSTPDTTSTFVDGVEYRYSDLFDVERVEILRGPQGTLWGSNAIGGTVQIITKAPVMNEFQVTGSMQVTQQEAAKGMETRADLAINIPLVEDKMALRITGQSSYEPGRYLNTYSGNHNYDKDRYLRAQLLVNASDDMSFKFGFIHSNEYSAGSNFADRSQPSGYYTMNLTEDAGEPYGWLVGYQFNECGSGQERWQCRQGGNGNTIHPSEIDPKYAYWEILDQYEQRTSNMATFNFDHANIADIASMSFVGSYRSNGDTGLDNWSRLDGNDMFRTWIVNHDIYGNAGKRTTAELRFNSIDEESPIQWTVGGYYNKENYGAVPDRQFQFHQGDDNGRTYAMANYWWGVDAAAVGQDLYSDPNKNYNINQLDSWYKELAAFGELSYIAPLGNGGEIEFNAGLRYYDLSDYDHTIESGVWIGPVANDAVLRGGESGTRKKFSLSYRPNEDFSIYGLYAEGYRPGGNNMPSLPHSCIGDENAKFYQPRYESDQIKNYEVGAKGNLADGKFRFSAAAYRIDWTGIQSSVYMASCGFSFTGNAVTAKSEGIEIETNTYLSDTLYVTANFSYTKSEITADAPSIQASAGDEMTFVPKYNGYVAVQKDLEIGERDAFVRAAISFYGETKSHFAVLEDLDVSPAYSTIDLSASINATDDVRVSFHIKNVANTDYTTYQKSRTRSGNPNYAHYYYYGRERSYTLRADFRF